jgi:hypothetical protein
LLCDPVSGRPFLNRGILLKCEYFPTPAISWQCLL